MAVFIVNQFHLFAIAFFDSLVFIIQLFKLLLFALDELLQFEILTIKFLDIGLKHFG